MDCYEHCTKHNISEIPRVELEKFKNEHAPLNRTLLAPYVEERIRAQLVKMYESVSTKSDFPYSLATGPSNIPNAGQGVFVECKQDLVPGTIVALYPGRVYQKFELLDDKIVQSLMPDDDFMLMLRRDDNLIDPRNLDDVPFNPFAFGHLINHCGAARPPNVYQVS